MKKDKAIVTLCIGKEFEEIGRLTHPFMKDYANKINADFIVIDKTKFLLKNRIIKLIFKKLLKFKKLCLFNRNYILKDYHPCFEKFQIYSLFNKYGRIIYIDTDVLISSNCPNLFDVVPYTHIGVFLESDFEDRDEEINLFQKVLGFIGWKKNYFNSGVMVLSKKHREIFNIKKIIVKSFNYMEQTQLNYNVQKLKIPICDIGYKFNHMGVCGKSNERFDSYIIHYAGKHHEDKPRIETIKKDIKFIESKNKF